jgi:hypothetical protein
MHESYEKEITAVVEARWQSSCIESDGTTLRKGRPNAPFRAKVVREMFNKLGDDEQAGLRLRAREAAQDAKDVYNHAMKSLPSKAPADRQR